MTKKTKGQGGEGVRAAAITAAAAIIVALITGVFALLQRQPATPVNATTTPPRHSITIFRETFDNNDADWPRGDGTDYEFKVSRAIQDGKYYRTMETFADSDGDFGTVPIPNIVVDDFCLEFDAEITDSVGDSSIVVIVRPSNYDSDTEARSYYSIWLHENGRVVVKVNPKSGTERQIADEINGIHWKDGKPHKARISFQDDHLEIFDATNQPSLITAVSLAGADYLANEGNIRLGTAIGGPSHKMTVEFDNVFIYDKCL